MSTFKAFSYLDILKLLWFMYESHTDWFIATDWFSCRCAIVCFWLYDVSITEFCSALNESNRLYLEETVNWLTKLFIQELTMNNQNNRVFLLVSEDQMQLHHDLVAQHLQNYAVIGFDLLNQINFFVVSLIDWSHVLKELEMLATMQLWISYFKVMLFIIP